MLRRKGRKEEPIDETWLLPYSDLLTLLLALFIVMFSISNIDKEKYARLAEQFNVIFAETGGLGGGNTVVIAGGDLNEGVSNMLLEDDKMVEIKKNIEGEIANRGYSNQVRVELNKEGLEISIQEVALFDSGEAEILPSVYPLLEQIAKILQTLDNNIRIVGHTDNRPIHNEKYRSNWDLSAMRAINVLHFLIDQGGLEPQRFSIEGYGEYKPKYDNSTEEGRAKNRRVEIFIARKYPLDENGENQESNSNAQSADYESE